MADNPHEQFEKKVLIALEASMKGIKEALSALSAMSKHASMTERSMKSMGRAEKDVKRATKDLTASFDKYNKKLSTVKKAQKAFYDSGRAMGSIIRTATKGAVAGIAALGIVIKRTGDTMIQFETVSINAESAVGRLRIAYSGMDSTAHGAMVSIQDLAGELTKFQSKGIAEMMMGMEKSFQQGMKGLMSVLSRGLGKQAGAAMMQDVLTSLDDQFDIIDKNVIGRIGKLSKDMQDARIGGKPTVAIGFGSQIIKEFIDIQVYAKDGGIAIQKAINQISREVGRLASMDVGATDPLRSWRDALARVGTIFEKLEQKILSTFGTKIAGVIDDVSKYVEDNMQSMLDHLTSLFARFKAWGGVEKLAKQAGKAMSVVLDVVKSLAKAVAWLATKFTEYGTFGKAAMLGIGAVLLSSNIRSLLMGIGKGALYSGQMLWGARTAAIAYSAALKSTAAAGALTKMQHLKGIGKTAGAGVVGGVGGYLAGGMAARGLGAEKGGVAEDFAEVGGAAAGAFAMTGNPYIAITAAVLATGKAVWDTVGYIEENDKVIAKLSETTKKYAKIVRDLRSKADSPYKQARADVQELEVEINNLDAQIMKKQQGAVWTLGFFADTSDLEKQLQDVRDKHRQATEAANKIRPPDIVDMHSLRDTLKRTEKEFQNLAKKTPTLYLKGEVELDAYHKALKKARDDVQKTREQIDKLKKIGINTDDLEVGMKRIRELENTLKELEKAGMGTTSAFANLAKELGKLRMYERLLGGMNGAMGNLKTIVDTLGPSATVAGQNIAEMMNVGSAKQMVEAFGAVEASTKAIVLARSKISEYEMAEDTPENAKQSAFWWGKLEAATSAVKLATGTIESSVENALAPLEKQAAIIRTMTELRKLDLDISQSLYGTPALAVQAQLNIVQLMQQEKEIVEGELSVLSSRIDMLRAAGVAEENLIGLRQKEIELAGKARKITADQLRQVKQLRDGYLDAIKAQSFGAGRFSKIIITQEKNLMRGLKKGATKRNYLLGQYAEDAAKTNAQAYRFSAQGQGILETTSGQRMSPEDISKAVYERVSNIADPLSRASALQSADIFMNIVSGADKNTQDLGNMFMVAQDSSATRIVDAINAQGETKVRAGAAAAALRDSPAGVTALGGAAERTGRGLDNFLGSYLKTAKEQGSAAGSINAMVDFVQRQNKKVTKTETSKKQTEPSVATQEQIARILSPIAQIAGDAFKGFLSGGGSLGGVIAGVQSGFADRKEAANQQRISAQGDEIMNALKSPLSPRRVSQSGSGKDARLGGVPTLQAYDTDSFTGAGGGTRDFGQEMARKFGRKSGANIARQAKRVQEAERKLQQSAKAIKGDPGQQFGTGVKDLHGFEIPGTAEVAERKAQRPQKKESKVRIARLKKVRDAEKSRLDKMTEDARKSQPAQLKKMDAEKARVERAATDKSGTTYSGKAPERVKGIALPENVLPAGIAGPPAMGQKRQLSGVSDPAKVRQLSHGATGNWASKGRGVKEKLHQAGQIIEEMGSEMDRVNTDQGNITQHGANRLFNIQPT